MSPAIYSAKAPCVKSSVTLHFFHWWLCGKSDRLQIGDCPQTKGFRAIRVRIHVLASLTRNPNVDQMSNLTLGLQDTTQTQPNSIISGRREGIKDVLLAGNQPKCEEHERSGFLHDV